MVEIPHFDLPFRFVRNVAATVEQNSDKDILNCVSAALRTEKGTRLYAPDFGVTDNTFEVQPIDTTSLLSEVRTSEPRADLAASQINDLLETEITIGVGTVGD